jgi:hypothetical protein
MAGRGLTPLPTLPIWSGTATTAPFFSNAILSADVIAAY